MDESLTNKLARRISLRQLQVFESVARQLSFTRAAQELFLSQPTVSMQIKKLESDIGLPLTEQIGKKISLTYTGQALHEASAPHVYAVALGPDDRLYTAHSPDGRVEAISSARAWS